jgi:hypothetical protein
MESALRSFTKETGFDLENNLGSLTPVSAYLKFRKITNG